jgi:hypothetical protein
MPGSNSDAYQQKSVRAALRINVLKQYYSSITASSKAVCTLSCWLRVTLRSARANPTSSSPSLLPSHELHPIFRIFHSLIGRVPQAHTHTPQAHTHTHTHVHTHTHTHWCTRCSARGCSALGCVVAEISKESHVDGRNVFLFSLFASSKRRFFPLPLRACSAEFFYFSVRLWQHIPHRRPHRCVCLGVCLCVCVCVARVRLQVAESEPPLVGAQVVFVNGKEVLGMTLEEVMNVIRDATAPGSTLPPSLPSSLPPSLPPPTPPVPPSLSFLSPCM